MARSRLRLAARIIGLSLLSLVGLVLAGAFTVFMVGRTDWGRHKLLATLLPIIQRSLTGRLQVGGLEGDLAHRLALRDVLLEDAEGQPAVRVRRVGLSYNLLALVHKTLHLTSVDVQGAWVHARYLQDGRLNLAALTRPKEKSSPPDITIRLGEVRLDLEAIYDAPRALREAPKQAAKVVIQAPQAAKTEMPKEILKEAARQGKEKAEQAVAAEQADGPMQRIHARLRARASALIQPARDVISATLEELSVEALDPLKANLEAKGGFQQKGDEMLVKALDLSLHSDGENLNKLVAKAGLKGAFGVDVKADGPLSGLRFEVTLRPPKGQLDLKGKIGATDQKLPWELTVAGRDIDPQAARPDLPTGRIGIDASGRGEGPRGTIDLQGLLVEMLDARLQASGRADLTGQGELQLDLKARDLGRFSRFAGVPLGGALQVSAQASRGQGHLRLQVDARGDKLRASTARVGRFDLHARTADLRGQVQLDARALRVGKIAVNTLSLLARGGKDDFTLRLAGEGPDETVVRLAAHGDVLYKDRAQTQPLGVDGVLERLVVGRGGQRWQTSGPARVRVDPAVRVAGLALASGDQRLTLHEARFDPQSQVLAVRLDAQGLDAKRIALMVPHEGEVPTTQIDLNVRAGGTTKAPVADVSVSGRSAALEPLQLPALQYHLQAHYGDERVRGQASVDTQGTKDVIKLGARFDVPVRPAGDLSAEVEATAPLDQLRRFMPPELEALRGSAQLNLRASGSLRHPEVAMQLRVPDWQTATLKGRDTALVVNYQGERLALKLGGQVWTTDQKRVGALDLNVSAPVRLGAGVTGAELRRSLTDTPVTGKLVLAQVDLGQLSNALIASQPPLTAGVVDANLDITGTVFDPTVHLAVDGRGLATPAIDQINLALRLVYERGVARLDLTTALRGAPILSAQAGLDLPMRRALQEHGPFWRELPLQVDVKIVPYDVRRLSKDAAGQIAGSVQVRGTLGKPLLEAQLGGEKLAFQAWPIGSVAVRASFDGAQAQAQLRALEPTGGQLRADAVLPMDAARPIKIDLVSKGYRLDYEPKERPKGAVRVLRGQLDADLHVDGLRAKPHPYGSVHLRDGAIGVAADPRVYRKVELDVGMDAKGLVNIRKIYASAEVGWVKVGGSAQLKGLRPERGNLLLEASRFPISAGSMSLWLDAKVSFRGETQGDVFRGTMSVDRGTVHLPKLASGGKKLQSTKPLDDVDYVDRGGYIDARKRAEEELKQKPKEKDAPPPLDELPTSAVIQLAVPGPLYIRGKEVNAEAQGAMKLELRGPLALISGNVEVPKGWVDLLGRRWDINQAVVSLDGAPEPNPILSVRISRKMGDAQIFVEVHGTALKPRVVMRSEPPIYSESQIIAMIITGDPENQRASNQSLDQKAIGAISGLVVGQIKDQLGEALPVDVLKVDVGGEGYNVFGETRVEVGKYLTDDLYVAYSHQFGSPSGTRRLNSNQLQLEYQFLRNFVIETLFGDAGIGALDIYWTKRF